MAKSTPTNIFIRKEPKEFIIEGNGFGVKLILELVDELDNRLRADDWLWIYKDRFGKFPKENNYSEHLTAHREMWHLSKGAKKHYEILNKYFGEKVIKWAEQLFSENPNKKMIRVYGSTNHKMFLEKIKHLFIES
jgi:hypothetical protein